MSCKKKKSLTSTRVDMSLNQSTNLKQKKYVGAKSKYTTYIYATLFLVAEVLQLFFD